MYIYEYCEATFEIHFALSALYSLCSADRDDSPVTSHLLHPFHPSGRCASRPDVFSVRVGGARAGVNDIEARSLLPSALKVLESKKMPAQVGTSRLAR